MRFLNLLSYQPPQASPPGLRAAPGTPCVLSQYGMYGTPQECVNATSCRANLMSRNYRSRADVTGVPCVLDQFGEYRSQEECQSNSSCGWKYKCVNNSCVRAAGGTYATLEECQQDPAAKCGWTYACAADGDPSTLCKLVPAVQGMYASAADCRCIKAAGLPGPDCACSLEPAGNAKYATLAACQSDPTDMCGWKYTCHSVDQYADLPRAEFFTYTTSNTFDAATQLLVIGSSSPLTTNIPVANPAVSVNLLKYVYVAYYVDYRSSGAFFRLSLNGMTSSQYANIDVNTVSPTIQFAVLPFTPTVTSYDSVNMTTSGVRLRIAAISFARYGDLTIDQAIVPF